MFESNAEEQARVAGERAVCSSDTHPLLLIDHVSQEYKGVFRSSISVIDLSAFTEDEMGIIQLLCMSGRYDTLNEMLGDSNNWIQKGVLV